MKLAFLYPRDHPEDALASWVRALGRHAHHEVVLATDGHGARRADVVFLLTQGDYHPRALCDLHLREMREYGVPCGVVHNWDQPAVPTPGHYPSFCWTRTAELRLAVQGFEPTLLRMPVFPPLVPPLLVPPRVATFGRIEAKKQTVEMARWARQAGIPFTAFVPRPWQEYEYNFEVVAHPYFERVEDLAHLMAGVSHFLFILPPSKGGTGGSPTSPRYAGFFSRPVIVVDDEDTYREDGFHVFRLLDDIGNLEAMQPPRYDWLPDAYLEALVSQTLSFWGK